MAELLVDHQVLTTGQLTAMLFTSPTTCLHRLHALRQLGVVDRFLRHRPGLPEPLHWVPGLLATRLVALARNEKPPTPAVVYERKDRTMMRPDLGHLIGVNQFFTDLIGYTRSHPQYRLARWWPEPRTADAYGRRVHPDGHGVWNTPAGSVGFFLEHDTGLEKLPVLTGKLDGYRRLRREGGPHYPVLFWLPTRAREQNLHRRLADGPTPGLVVATAARDTINGHSPAGPIWRLYGNGRHRLHLADIPSHHATPGPLNPAAPTPEQDPLAALAEK
ncbi:replication-relaxation family protein [Phytohabitans houttuyneae]|uniref:replication-relaxation family protein n=1 Tax=Phytohabitans houttuyneae TaxID=1076126 RepID=UPI0024844066|nr:replication-relaxation family protein [Phytohabitans houttuyneae]